MSKNDHNALFTPETLASLFPDEKSDRFFDALFGDASEGAYDIRLSFIEHNCNSLHFELQLIQRPGKCLGCHLTYGLPQVFSRHPVIDIKGLVDDIGKLVEGRCQIEKWQLGATRELSRELHVIPLTIYLTD
ncbi:MAG: pancreas/duodenum homeobox protein 1 [Desulfobacterales bacterium]|jgi:hypothetical protein|nr:pancreas/duodenum homeobox protein 1 [Desulfobacterales bacterium]